MNIIVTDRTDGTNFKPTNKTAIIRIFENPLTLVPGWTINGEEQPLVNAKDFVTEKRYYFDDVDSEDTGMYHGINKNIAKLIIDDFIEYKDKIETLVVHCRAGECRSPAVAMALNEIFQLNSFSMDDWRLFPNYNRFVYKTILETAFQNGIYVPKRML